MQLNATIMSEQNNEKFWFLKDLDIYEGISDASFCTIAPNSVDKRFPKDTQIYSPHEPDNHIYVVHRGEVILYHSKDGKRSIFDTLGPGSVFGTFDPKHPTPGHFAITTKNTELCVTPVNEFLKVIASHPEAMLKLMQKMTMRIQDYERKIHTNIETASERVYSELVRLKTKRQKGFIGKITIPLRITHEQLAEYTNLNRVTVTRSLKKLKEMGVIDIDKTSGSIELNEDRLKF